VRAHRAIAEARRLGAALARGPRRLALLWGAGVFVTFALLASSPGISRDEAAVLAAAAPSLSASPSPSPSHSPPSTVPPLAPTLARATHAVATRLGIPHLTGFRLGSVLAAALLAAMLSLLAHDLAGRTAAALAPALALAAPRLLHAGLVAGPDGLSAALALATVWAYRRSLGAATAGARVRAAALAAVLLGLALATRLDMVILLPALAAHALLVRILRPRRQGPQSRSQPLPPERPELESAGAPEPLAPLEASLRGVPVALAAMLIVAPALLLALWPGLWADPGRRLAAIFAAAPGEGAVIWLGEALRGPRPPLGYPLAVTALALPLALLWTWGAGLLHAAVRLVRAVRGGPGVSDELLLLLAALAPLVAAQVGLAPDSAGVRPWLASFPFLAALGARALVAAAGAAWPSRPAPLTLALAVLACAPGLQASAHAWPHGASAWGELAGGAPGAASLGLQRQDGGEATAGVLEAVSERARPGARIHWPLTPLEAVRIYQQDGRLRADLALATAAAEADLVVLPREAAGSRDLEYQAWGALRTATPSAAAFLDEVPLAFVYARQGAWR
jgi:hypothetical protein